MNVDPPALTNTIVAAETAHPNGANIGWVCTFCTPCARLLNGFYIMGMLTVAASYSGSLISFLSVDVYPEPPDTLGKVVEEVREGNLSVVVCCFEIQENMAGHPGDSLPELAKEVCLSMQIHLKGHHFIT